MELPKPMRLLFLCSCLEPGRDGVGDYVRLLAGACARLGHPCALLALNDPAVTEPEIEEGASLLPALRLPAVMPWPQRIARAAAFRDGFAPDWISFHLVSYAFHPRGLLSGLVGPFSAIVGPRPLHLMFHEIWLGGGRPTPWRRRFIGLWQRRAIRRLLDRLRPRLVTTSNPVYAGLLARIGAPAEVLPLFGNIPVEPPGGADAAILPALARVGLEPANRPAWWIGLFFGALHPEWRPEPFLTLLQEAARKAGRQVCLVLAGRAGAAGESTWRAMETAYPRVRFLRLGVLPAAAISAWLRAADFGIAASPWQLIGKSGTVAAMLDHGLPVIVTRDDYQPYFPDDRPPAVDPLLHRLDAALPEKLAAGLPKREPSPRVGATAAQLCAALERAGRTAPGAP